MSSLYPLLALLFLMSCTACGIDMTTGNAPGEVVVVGKEAPSTPAGGMNAVALSLVNEVRASGCKCGSKRMPPVPALNTNQQLTTAAARHSADMAKMRDMRHQGSDGSKVGIRVTRAGYTWRNVGENIGWNYPSMEAMVAGWLDSPGHCSNIMSADFTEMGVAVNQAYYTMVLARKR